MAKILCKSVRKDGSPCQGQGLEQFDGYCIAHGPADKVRESRARGGRNSSTAARADKRIPERMQSVIKGLAEGFIAVREGTLSPAVYTAMCRGAREMRDSYRLADAEMELIRTEETQAAAEEMAGTHLDLDILKAASEIVAQQNQYRIDSLVDQGLAEPEIGEDKIQTDEFVLTAEGRKRFDQQLSVDHHQFDIDEMKEAAEKYTFKQPELPVQIKHLAQKRTDMENTLAELTHDPASDLALPPKPASLPDPLTGQPMNELPAGVNSGRPTNPDETKPSAAMLEQQIHQVEEQIREYQEKYEDEDYPIKRSRFHAGFDPEDDRFTIVGNQEVHFPKINLIINRQYWHKRNDESEK